MAKRGQSKYMPHLRAVQSPSLGIQYGMRGGVAEQHDAMNKKAETNAAKGKRGGDCNRTQCQRPHAWWYNKTMQAYYCGECAKAINESCLFKDHIIAFGTEMIYVNPPSAWIDAEVGGTWDLHVTTHDGTESIHDTFQTSADAEEALRRWCYRADLRNDGSAPFHYSELPQKMTDIKTRLIAMGLMEEAK